MKDAMDWVDKKTEEIEKAREEGYFNIEEGDNRVQLLTHCAPLAQVWTGKKYEVAKEGEKNASIKGVCWVLQDELIKQAKLPYTVVKAIRDLQQDQDYAFEEFPMPRFINIKAKGAGTKEVEYTVMPAPKETPVSKEVLTELAKKMTPEEIVEKIKGKDAEKTDVQYPDAPEGIPFSEDDEGPGKGENGDYSGMD